MNRKHREFMHRRRASSEAGLPFCVRRIACTLQILAAWGVAAVASATAEESEVPIWGRTMPAQPFEAEPFREIRVPAWVEETVGAGYTLSVLDRPGRERAAALGVTLSEMGFVDPLYVYYESALLERRNPHVPEDRLASELRDYRDLGVRVLAVVPPTLQGEVWEKHPEWRRVTTDTDAVPEVDLVVHPHGGPLCLLGPYGDFLIDLCAEVATLHPEVAAFSFDGLHHGGVCYCAHCRANHRSDHDGAPIPRVDPSDPAFRRYQHWADRRLEAMVTRLQSRLKAIRPELALVTWTTNAGRFGHLLDIPRNMPARLNLLFDAPDQEFWMDESNRGATILPAFSNAYVWALTNHRVAFSEPYLMSHGSPYGKDSFPAHEVLLRSMLVLTHGARPSLAVLQPEPLQAGAHRALEEVRRRREWAVRRRPLPWAALLVSDNTRVFHGRSPGEVEERHLGSVLGFYRAALEEHLPLTLICDWNLTDEDLAPYSVLVLPDAACLDDAQASAVRRFVERGGGLVASLDTGRCDEFGDPRPDPVLTDVLGIRFTGHPVEWSTPLATGSPAPGDAPPDGYGHDRRHGSARLVVDPDDGGLLLDSDGWSSLVGSPPASVAFRGPWIAVAPSDSDRRIAAWMEPGTESPGADRIPAVIVGRYGEGRTVYLAAGFDSAYYHYPYPYQRVLLRRAIEHVAARPAPIVVDAPFCVHAVPFLQKVPRLPGAADVADPAAERLLVHLFNNVNTTAFHGRPHDDVPLREESIPILDLRIRGAGDAPATVVLEPEGLALPVRELPEGGWEVRVPRLDVHSVLVAEPR